MFLMPMGLSRSGLVVENLRRMHYECAECAVFGDEAALRKAIGLWEVVPKLGRAS